MSIFDIMVLEQKAIQSKLKYKKGRYNIMDCKYYISIDNEYMERRDPKRVTPEKFLAYIEISKGMKNKYELDKETGMLFLDRILYTSTHYPANYGFIPHTYCGDHDPLDVLVICSEEILPMTILNCKPIGCFKNA